jgi:hypothetical protein
LRIRDTVLLNVFHLALSLYGGMPTTALRPASSSRGATSTRGRPVTFLFFEDAM